MKECNREESKCSTKIYRLHARSFGGTLDVYLERAQTTNGAVERRVQQLAAGRVVL